jgi:hypothetical protein
MLLPQPTPAAFAVPFTHIDMPLEHDATPLWQMPGLPEQLCPSVHVPQNPNPSQTWLEPHDMPAMMLPVPSTQVGAPVVHEMTPLLHTDGLPLHPLPAVHAMQVPEALHTMFVPQLVPAGLFASSMHVGTPVMHEVTPRTHAACGFVVHAWPPVHGVHWPFALQTWLAPQPVPAFFGVPSTHVSAPVEHAVTPV